MQKMGMDLIGYDACVKSGFVYTGLVLAALPLAQNWLLKGITLKDMHRKTE